MTGFDPSRLPVATTAPAYGRCESGMGRRIILNNAPVTSPWHLPVGVSSLTAVLEAEGHSVIQRYSHLLGLEHLLRAHGGEEAVLALDIVRDLTSDASRLYEARQSLERTSRSLNTPDRFAILRNNVIYSANGYDGTIDALLKCVRGKERNLWYPYFRDVEMPIARVNNPELYGISINDERQLVPGVVLAAMIKEASPETLVVLGGNFWSRMEHVFHMPEFAEIFDFVDAIVYGEGFQPMSMLAMTLNPAAVPATAWKDGGRVVQNRKPATPTKFENLPTPNYRGGEVRMWCPEEVFPLYTMSNCPQGCTFCSISGGSDTFLGKPRSMPPHTIAEHMQHLGHRFDVFDETFAVRRQLELGEELRKIGHEATWQCYLTITNDLLKPERCKQLYDAGCRAVQLGLETLSVGSLNRKEKKWNHPESYGAILRNLASVGIQTHVFIIVGIPGEAITDTIRWLPFLEDYGDSILTIKASRYRLARNSPDERSNNPNSLIDVVPTAPLRLNREFVYQNKEGRSVRKDVEAALELLEEACRRHWAYAVTSTIPWWTNRGRYTWQELRDMSKQIPEEPRSSKLQEALRRVGRLSEAEYGVKASLDTFEELVAFSRRMS